MSFKAEQNGLQLVIPPPSMSFEATDRAFDERLRLR